MLRKNLILTMTMLLTVVACEKTGTEVPTAPASPFDCTELTHTTHGKTCYLLRCDGYRLSTLFCEDAK